jgi:hypothetical protein
MALWGCETLQFDYQRVSRNNCASVVSQSAGSHRWRLQNTCRQSNIAMDKTWERWESHLLVHDLMIYLFKVVSALLPRQVPTRYIQLYIPPHFAARNCRNLKWWMDNTVDGSSPYWWVSPIFATVEITITYHNYWPAILKNGSPFSWVYTWTTGVWKILKITCLKFRKHPLASVFGTCNLAVTRNLPQLTRNFHNHI